MNYKSKEKVNYFFQNAGINNDSTVNNSRRPVSIMKHRYHLAASGTSLKCPLGPTSPSPGPTLPIHEMVAPTDSSNPIPINESTRKLTIIMARYKNKKANILVTESIGTTCPLSLTGNTALGCA